MNNEINKTREILSKYMDQYNDLLDTLVTETAELNSYDLQKFNERLTILDNFCSIVLHYDRLVMPYIRHDRYNDNKNKEQLDIARKYIERLGGDYNIVMYGKLSDY